MYIVKLFHRLLLALVYHLHKMYKHLWIFFMNILQHSLRLQPLIVCYLNYSVVMLTPRTISDYKFLFTDHDILIRGLIYIYLFYISSLERMQSMYINYNVKYVLILYMHIINMRILIYYFIYIYQVVLTSFVVLYDYNSFVEKNVQVSQMLKI